MKKSIRLWTAVLVSAACLILYGCSVKVDEESQETHKKIIGTWEVINIYEKEVMRYSDGQVETILDQTRNIKQTDEDYCVFKIDESSIRVLASGDPELAKYIDIPISYNIYNGNHLHSILLAGDYTDLCTIQELSDNKMVLYQEDIGYDSDNNLDAYYLTITLRRVDDNIIFIDYEYRDLIQKLIGNWETTHITEKTTMTSKNGQVEVLKDIDTDLTPADIDYKLLYFGYFNVRMFASGDPEMESIIGDPYSYRVHNMNQLYCVLFEGAYTDYCTIDEITDDKLVLTLEDKGTNMDDETYENNRTVTYERIIINN